MMDFYSQVICKDARFSSPHRISDLLLLEPVFLSQVLDLVAAAEEIGHMLTVFETYRSRERQQLLFAQGSSKLSDVGVHHYGLACDVLLLKDGSPDWQGDYGFLQGLAVNQGLIWGGDWGEPKTVPSYYDGYHLQRCAVGKQLALFSGTWYPDSNYMPIQDHLTLSAKSY